MKQAITLFLGACILLAAALPPTARAEGVITLKSGENCRAAWTRWTART